MKHNRSAS